MYRLFLALRYLRSRPVNLIAVGGVMFGVAVLIVVTSVMDGFRERVLSVVRGNLSDLVMTPRHPPDEKVPDYLQMDREVMGDARVSATAPEVETIVFFLHQPRYRAQPTVAGYAVMQVQALGIDFERERHVSRIGDYLMVANDPERPFYSVRKEDRMKAGTVFISRTFAEHFLGAGRPVHLPREPEVLEEYGTLLEMPPEAGEVLDDYGKRLDSALERDAFKMLLDTDLGISFANLGDAAAPTNPAQGQLKASWNTYQLPISAIYDGQDTSMDLSRIYMARDTLRYLAGIDDEYHSIRVKLHDPQQAKEVKRDFLEQYPNFHTATWEEFRADFIGAVNNEKVLLAIVLSFIVLLGGFVILATLTLTVVEKTRDIGILAALGATRGGILSLFIFSGIFIGVLGALLGVGLGWLFTSNVDWVHDQLKSVMGVEIFPSNIYLFREIPTLWSWGTVAWIVGGSLLMAFVAGAIPAWRAARMDPVRALRYE